MSRLVCEGKLRAPFVMSPVEPGARALLELRAAACSRRTPARQAHVPATARFNSPRKKLTVAVEHGEEVVVLEDLVHPPGGRVRAQRRAQDVLVLHVTPPPLHLARGVPEPSRAWRRRLTARVRRRHGPVRAAVAPLPPRGQEAYLVLPPLGPLRLDGLVEERARPAVQRRALARREEAAAAAGGGQVQAHGAVGSVPPLTPRRRVLRRGGVAHLAFHLLLRGCLSARRPSADHSLSSIVKGRLNIRLGVEGVQFYRQSIQNGLWHMASKVCGHRRLRLGTEMEVTPFGVHRSPLSNFSAHGPHFFPR